MIQARSFTNKRLNRFLEIMDKGRPIRWDQQNLALVALYERPTLRIADSNYFAARAGLITAREIPNPKLSLNAAYNTTDFIPNPWSIGPTITFLIRNFFATHARVSAAHEKVVAARLAILSTVWVEWDTVYRAYSGLWAALQLRTLANHQALLAQEIYQATLERYRAGAASATALNLAELAMQKAAFAVSTAVLHLRLTRTSLASAVGMPARAIIHVKFDFSTFYRSFRLTNLDSAEHYALAHRPSVLAARAKYYAAQYLLKYEIDRVFPSFKMKPGYTYSQGVTGYAFGANAHLPLFNQNQGPIALAHAQVERADLEVIHSQDHVLSQIDHAKTYLNASLATLRSARREVSFARDQEAAAEQAYDAGLIGALRLLGAEQVAVAAEKNQLTARADERRAVGDLEDALHKSLTGVTP
ncbi:TolC family protein [Acidiphilium sp.]|uniref:TolC family protein n=1 Tax=Acidiphilium sp. TaxID=527 RepID=UPI003D001E14